MQTINILEVLDGRISSIVSFPRDEEGEIKAKETFVRILSGNGYPEDVVEESYNGGFFDDDNGYTVQVKYGILIKS